MYRVYLRVIPPEVRIRPAKQIAIESRRAAAQQRRGPKRPPSKPAA